MIAVYDSGVGGLSILHLLTSRLPHASYLYFADQGFSPYGEKSVKQLRDRAQLVCQFLQARGAILIVLACNTLTLNADINVLRENFSHISFVGVEPGIKPALAATRNQKILIAATRRSCESPWLQEYLATQKATITCLPLPNLVAAIEKDNKQAVSTCLAELVNTVEQLEVDTLVLGCTHFPLVKDQLRRCLPSKVQIIDTGPAVVNRVLSLYTSQPKTSNKPQIKVLSTATHLDKENSLTNLLASQTQVELVSL